MAGSHQCRRHYNTCRSFGGGGFEGSLSSPSSRLREQLQPPIPALLILALNHRERETDRETMGGKEESSKKWGHLREGCAPQF